MELYKNVLDIYDITIGNNLIRNIGVRVSDLTKYRNNQISLFEEEHHESDDKIQSILDDINVKYNDLKIMPAIFYSKKNKDKE